MKFRLDEIGAWHRVAIADNNYRIDRMARLTAQERELIDHCVPDLLAEVKRLTDLWNNVGEQGAAKYWQGRCRDADTENADLRRQITELQTAQRERELRLTDFVVRRASDFSWGSDEVAAELDAFNTQEQES